MITGFMLYIPKVKQVGVLAMGEVRIMLYNLKYASSDYDEWNERRDTA